MPQLPPPPHLNITLELLLSKFYCKVKQLVPTIVLNVMALTLDPAP